MLPPDMLGMFAGAPLTASNVTLCVTDRKVNVTVVPLGTVREAGSNVELAVALTLLGVVLVGSGVVPG